MLYDWFQHIEFKNVWVLPFLLALPVIAWFYYRTPGWRKSTFKVSTTRTFTVQTIKSRLVNLPFWLRLLAIGCIIVALARPQVRNVQSRTRGQGIDIILCMDVSGSMLSADFFPNRLEVSKQMAAEFVQQRPIGDLFRRKLYAVSLVYISFYFAGPDQQPQKRYARRWHRDRGGARHFGRTFNCQ
jgi:Ca-activated chloride channel family protein